MTKDVYLHEIDWAISLFPVLCGSTALLKALMLYEDILNMMMDDCVASSTDIYSLTYWAVIVGYVNTALGIHCYTGGEQ